MCICCSSYLFSSSEFTRSIVDLVNWNCSFPWPI
ncbi:hypothetical protein NC652_025236 [Populus alba x Populus x berolinensis]|nr:hypothetical protein NC652_025236 [Populus alba x Populus x berolinensis]